MRRMILLVCALMLCLTGCGEMQGKISMKYIWRLTDTNEFVIAMTEHLDKKTQYGDDMSGLSEAERIFYITQTLEMEVSNGGFSQFFYNSSGDFSNELVSAFTAIGANKTAAICQKAIDAFGCEIPVDRAARVELLDKLENDNIDKVFEECDDAFFSYEEDLNELNYNFVMKNKEQFT